MKKFLYYMSMFTFALCGILILVVTYWLVYPYKVLSFQEGNGIITATTVQSGEYVDIQQNSCKYMNIPSQINRQFIDGVIFEVPTVYAKRPMGCSSMIEKVYVPKAIPPGMYSIRTTISFKVNPIRHVEYVVTTNKFTIVK